MRNFMIRLLQFFLGLFSLFRSQAAVTSENIVFRQQMIAWKEEKPRSPITNFDRIFWVMIRMVWKKWKNNLIIVKPDTVVRWHRKLFKLFWKHKSRNMSSLEKALLKKVIHRLVFKLAMENSITLPRLCEAVSDAIPLGTIVGSAPYSPNGDASQPR